jgi:hypothetical protein
MTEKLTINQHLKDGINTLADLKSLLFSTKSTVAIGILLLSKRSGFLMAMRLIVKSRFTPLFLEEKSIRSTFINNLRSEIKKLKYKRGEYVLVMGEKGIGKTTAVETALHHFCGVMKFSATGSDYKNLKPRVLSELLGGISTGYLNYLFKHSLNSLLFWHKLLVRRPPIIVVEVFEGISNKELLFSDIRDVSFN